MPPRTTSSLGFTANENNLRATFRPIRTDVNGIPLLAAGHYYEGDNRAIAKAMKEGNPEAIDHAARHMIPLIPRGAVLVPIPGHEGVAKQTNDLCRAIASYTGLPIANVLRGASREANYTAKHEGKGLTEKDMAIHQVASLPKDKTPVFVDNVIDTGTTAKAAYHAVGRGMVIAFAMSDTLMEQQKVLHGMHR